MADSKHTKRALLGSALALVLCFAMLLGTTFAWFTDTASTTVNTIQAGTLDVDITTEKGKSLNGVEMPFEGKGGNNAKLWEPGATYQLPSFKIVNNGNLALKCKIVINGFDSSSETDEAKLLKAIDFTVKFKEFGQTSIDGHISYGWIDREISLSDFSEGEYIIYPDVSDYGNQLDWLGESPLFTIEAHMREDAGNEYQGLSLKGLGITVLATQATVEEDINGHDYDADATYPTLSNP